MWPFSPLSCRATDFRQGKVDTGFIDRNLAALGAVPHEPDRAAAALGVVHLLKGTAEGEFADGDASADEPAEASSPWAASDGFQLGGTRSHCRAGRDRWRERRRDGRLWRRTACASRSTARRRQPTRGCSKAATRLMCCAMAARPACASRILPPRPRRPDAGDGVDQGADAWQGSGAPRRASAIAWPPANVSP